MKYLFFNFLSDEIALGIDDFPDQADLFNRGWFKGVHVIRNNQFETGCFLYALDSFAGESRNQFHPLGLIVKAHDSFSGDDPVGALPGHSGAPAGVGRAVQVTGAGDIVNLFVKPPGFVHHDDDSALAGAGHVARAAAAGQADLGLLITFRERSHHGGVEVAIGVNLSAADEPEVLSRMLLLAEEARLDLGDARTRRVGSGVREPGRVP